MVYVFIAIFVLDSFFKNYSNSFIEIKCTFHMINSSKAAISNKCATRILKHPTPDYLVRSTELFSLRLSNKKMTAANTTRAVRYECPVFNYKYIRYIIELHLIGHVA